MGGSSSATPRKTPANPKSILKNNNVQPAYADPYYPGNVYGYPPNPPKPANMPVYGQGVAANNQRVYYPRVHPAINGGVYPQVPVNNPQPMPTNDAQPTPYGPVPQQFPIDDHHHPHYQHYHQHSPHLHHHPHHPHHHHHHHHHDDDDDEDHIHEHRRRKRLALRPTAATVDRKKAGVGNDFQTQTTGPLTVDPLPPPQVKPISAAQVKVEPARTPSTVKPTKRTPSADSFEKAPPIRSVFIPRSPGNHSINNYESDVLPIAQRVYSQSDSNGPKWYDQEYDQRVKPLVLEEL